MKLVKRVWLLYTSKFSEHPALVFDNATDAKMVCDAINHDRHVSSEDDLYVAFVEAMPVCGGGEDA